MLQKDYRDYINKKHQIQDDLAKLNKSKEKLYCWSWYYQNYKMYDDYQIVQHELVDMKKLIENKENELNKLLVENGYAPREKKVYLTKKTTN